MRRQNGFTLVEILISTLIFGVIIGGILAVLKVADMSWHTDMGLLDLQQQLRMAVDGMSREIRQTSHSRILGITNGGSRVDFTLPGITNAVSYYLSNSQIIREHPVGEMKVLASDTNILNFCCVGGAGCTDCGNAHVIQITAQATKTVRNRPLSFSLKEQVRFRNE